MTSLKRLYVIVNGQDEAQEVEPMTGHRSQKWLTVSMSSRIFNRLCKIRGHRKKCFFEDSNLTNYYN